MKTYDTREAEARQHTAPLLSKTARLDDPYVVAGSRAYLVGAQDGSFPPLGHHLPGEMGGFWAHPHKLLEGIWCGLRALGAIVWFPAADRFDTFPWGVRQWFSLPDQQLRITRTLVVPDHRQALIVDLQVEDMGGGARTLELVLAVHTRLRQGWSDFDRPEPSGTDRAVVDAAHNAMAATDATGTWSVAWGSLRHASDATVESSDILPAPVSPRGITGSQCFHLHLRADDTAILRLAVHGGEGPVEAAVVALQDLLHHADHLIVAKQQRFATMLASPRLESPEPVLNQLWTWTHVAYDWLYREVPGVGTGLGAGVPDYPWWFSCDTAYALRGMLPLGGADRVAQTLRLLAAASARANAGTGRIIHELTCTGSVVNLGNTQETPQFAVAVLETYLWSGDRLLLDDLYPLCHRGVLDWTLQQCDADGDGLPEGYGITEILGLDAEMIDSAVWTYCGLCALGRMATILGDTDTAATCAARAPQVRAAIEQRFWSPEHDLYADLIATPEALRPRLAQLLARLEQSGEESAARQAMVPHLRGLLTRLAAASPGEETCWFFGNSVINVPLEAGISAPQRAAGLLARLEQPPFMGPDGVYLNYVEQGAAMSIATGILAAAEVAYGRVEQALDLARLLAGQLHLRTPGAISEMSPDGGCFVHAWSGYGAIYPIACGVFGLFPDAGQRLLVLAPFLPAGWDTARLHDVQIRGAHFDLALQRGDGGALTCTISVDQPGWRVALVSSTQTIPRTPLTLHAAPAHDTWGLHPALTAPIPLTPGRAHDLPIA